jgi:two-component system osmolarity sensor histidine kinase EnvZ
MSVADPQARDHMAADIEQLDAIIDKFLDYARPDTAPLQPVSLQRVITSAVYAFESREDMRIEVDVPGDLDVMADEVELGRVLANLLENARKYGKTEDTGIANVEIAAKARDDRVLMKIRDHGLGVSPTMLGKLTQPFYRGDAARTAATGAGLGLAIVERTITRMGGLFTLANTSSGGLAAHISLPRAKNH